MDKPYKYIYRSDGLVNLSLMDLIFNFLFSYVSLKHLTALQAQLHVEASSYRLGCSRKTWDGDATDTGKQI